MQMLVMARAAGLMPLGFIGTVADYKDLDGLRRATQRARRLGFQSGLTVQEVGYDDDVDLALRGAIEEVVGEDLVDEDFDDVVDVVVLWWREDDGDLAARLGVERLEHARRGAAHATRRPRQHRVAAGERRRRDEGGHPDGRIGRMPAEHHAVRGELERGAAAARPGGSPGRRRRTPP